MTDCKQAKLCHLIFIVVVKLLAVAQGQTFNYQNFSQSWDCPRDGIIRGNFPHQPRLNLGAFIAHPRFWTTLIPTSRSGQDIAAFRLVREWPESTQPLSFRVTPTQHGEPGRIIVHLAMNDINPMSSAEGGFLYENSQNDVKQFFPYKVLHFEKGMGGRDYHPSLDGGPNYEPAYQLIRRGLFNCFIQRYAHINLNDDESYERGSTDCSAGRKNPICCYTAFPKKEYEAIMEEMKATGERSYDWPKKMENNMFDERGEEYQCTKGCTETCYPLHCKIAKFYIGNQGDWKNERPGDELCSQVAEKYAEYENDVGKNQLEGSERFREDSLKHKDDVGADPTTFRSPFNKRVIETLQTCKIKSKAYEEAKQMFKDKKLLWETLRNPDTWREYEFNGIPESVREMDSKDWDQQWTEMRHDNLLVREQLKTPWHKSRHHVPDPGDDPIPEIRPCRASCYDGMIIQVEFIPIRMHEDFRSSKMRISLIGRRWMHFDQSMRTGGVDLMQYIKDQRGMYFGDFDKGEYNNRIDYDSIEIKYMPGEDGKIPVLVKGQEKGIWMKWVPRTLEKKEGPILQKRPLIAASPERFCWSHQMEDHVKTTIQNFLHHVEALEARKNDGENTYAKEFQELKSLSDELKNDLGFSTIDGEMNTEKNRYKNILPFDHNRVILSEAPGVDGSTYINASYIKGPTGSNAYIATQAPVLHTVNDFWRMIVEREVEIIVTACRQWEEGKRKCEGYWNEHKDEERLFGNIFVKLIKSREKYLPDFLVRTMRIRWVNVDGNKEERLVSQFHFLAWPDHGIPTHVSPVLAMLKMIREYQETENPPVVIHCSAGCGRTGSILAIDFIWGLLRSGKLDLDFSVFKVIRDLRRQRTSMVQTVDQYIFVHRAVRKIFLEFAAMN